MKYTLYIGSNNETKELETNKTLEIIASYHDAFSYYTIKEVWQTNGEDTLKVEIFTDEALVTMELMIEILKEALQQDSIGLEVAEINLQLI